MNTRTRPHFSARDGGARMVTLRVAVLTTLVAAACAPVVPLRSKPGGAAHWAHTRALPEAARWAPAALLCRIFGLGVGHEGWLPDRGGIWKLTYWAPEKTGVLEVSVDSDGNVSASEAADSPARGRTLPPDWQDSPKVWHATTRHLRGDPISTFEAEFAHDAEPERYPGQAVWRIRFYLQEGGFETHVVSSSAEWLASY